MVFYKVMSVYEDVLFDTNVMELLPNCSQKVWGRYYASELIEITKDDKPPFYVFSKEPEQLTEGEINDIVDFGIIIGGLQDFNNVCDKVGMLYLVRTFRYEYVGGLLGSHFKELFEELRVKNGEIFRVAYNITKYL